MIKYSIRGENLEVTDALRDYVVSKLEKIEKYFQAEQELAYKVKFDGNGGEGTVEGANQPD